MEEFLSTILGAKSKPKTLSEYEQIVKTSGMMWKKPYEYNTPIAGHMNFDDFFKISGAKDAKLCKFTVKCFERGDGSIEYLRGIQFFYKGKDGKVFEGFDQTNPECLPKGKMKAVTFELDDDEYPIKIIGRTGLFVDKFGFHTTKGIRNFLLNYFAALMILIIINFGYLFSFYKISFLQSGRDLVFGGEGGGERNLEAPKGLHFTKFGSIQCGDGIFSVLCESGILPKGNDKDNQ